MEILLGCGGFDREAGMKIYQITIVDAHEGTVYAWASNKAEATEKYSVLLDALQRKRGKDDSIEEIDFPTSAQGIAQWLNLRFTRDNG
jgi:hypothetical protein